MDPGSHDLLTYDKIRDVELLRSPWYVVVTLDWPSIRSVQMFLNLLVKSHVSLDEFVVIGRRIV